MADMGDGLSAVFIPLGDHEQLPEERLVVAALGCLISTGVDQGGIFCQLQGHPELCGLDGQSCLGLSQRLFGLLDLLGHASTFLAEGIAGYVVALFGVEPYEPLLLGLKLADQLGLGLAHLLHGLAADGCQGFNCACAFGDLLLGELDGTVAVVPLNGLVDQLGVDVGPHFASRAVDAGATEEVGILAAVATRGDPKTETLTTAATEDAALEVVPVDLWPLACDALLIEQRLHPIEGVLVDQGLVTTGEGLLLGGTALVDDPACVVGVSQDALQAGAVDLLRRALLARP